MDQSYSDKLKDPRWQRVRLVAMQAAQWRCQICEDTKEELNVHHIFYRHHVPSPIFEGVNGVGDKRPFEPWEYPLTDLRVLCRTCHTLTHLPANKVEIFAAAEIFPHSK